MSKNVAVFVDVANIFYAAKAAGVDIDYVTLLKASSAGRDLVRAYAYTGLDPENENQRNFHDFLRRHGYKVVSKDIRKYGDGKVKANLDIELVVDMMKTARNLDIAIVVSGDGDFAPAIRAVQEMGVRVEVVSFRGNTSSDLIDVADIFTDITQIAKVEKGSARSGRRVADDDEDLSMTEVPEKQSEGSGDGRRRGRGSRRVAASGETSTTRASTTRASTTRASTTRTRASTSHAAAAREAVVVEGTLVALPGEKLSRAARHAAAEQAAERAPEAGLEPEGEPVESTVDGGERAVGVEGAEVAGADGQVGEEGHRRRRRRRGGRGRGRGGAVRVEGEEALAEGTPLGVEVDELEEPEPLPTPRRQAFSFGTVWDSQLGKAPAGAVNGPGGGPIADEEDLEEPSIPEYLLAERRQREGARGRPGRGGASRRGGAYAAALDRERFGGGRGSAPVSRFAEPGQRHRDAGSGRPGGGIPSRSGGRGYERPEPRGSSNEPWSEVPPEIEAMLRAQMAGAGRGSRPAPARESRQAAGVDGRPVADAGSRAGEGGPETAGEETAAPSAEPVGRSRRAPTSRRAPAARAADAALAGTVDAASAKPSTRARRSAKTAADAASADGAVADASAPAKRTRRAKPSTGASTAAPSGDEPPAPTRRVSRRKAATAD